MLQLFNSTLAMVIALACLVALLTAPFLLAWFLWRIASDLRRIADAQEIMAESLPTASANELYQRRLTPGAASRRVSNSMFGR